MPTDRRSSRPALPAAVSTLVAGAVHGEPVDARVLAAHRYALYLSVRGSVLPVVTADAVALPTAVRLAVPAASVRWGVDAGDAVRVGAGRLSLPRLDVVAARGWRPARVRRVPDAPASAAGCPGGRGGSHLSTRLELERATRGVTGVDRTWLADGIRLACPPVPAPVTRVGCPAGCRGSRPSTQLVELHPQDAVASLVGRGPGLTPSGDDALAGALLLTHALGIGRALADAVRARLHATTAVSAALLDAAADGYAARPVVTLVDAAVAGDPDAVRRALPAVLAIGHTSGADTVTGILAALRSRRGCGSGCQGDRVDAHGETTTGRSAA